VDQHRADPAGRVPVSRTRRELAAFKRRGEKMFRDRGLRGAVVTVRRYRTAEEAEHGHAEVCMDIRQMAAKIEMAEQVHDEALEAING
jgi:hypothetical protein